VELKKERLPSLRAARFQLVVADPKKASDGR